MFTNAPERKARVLAYSSPAYTSGSARALSDIETGEAIITNYVQFRYTTPATWAFERMAEAGLDGAVVVADDRKPIGYAPLPPFWPRVQQFLDLGQLDQSESRNASLGWSGSHSELFEAVMGHVMLPVIEVYEFVPLLHAAAHMAYEGVGHALVRSGDETLLGILTMESVVLCLAENSGYSLGPNPRPNPRQR